MSKKSAKRESPYARLDRRFSKLYDMAMGAKKEKRRVDLGTYTSDAISAIDLKARVDVLQRLGFTADLKLTSDGIALQGVEIAHVEWWTAYDE